VELSKIMPHRPAIDVRLRTSCKVNTKIFKVASLLYNVIADKYRYDTAAYLILVFPTTVPTVFSERELTFTFAICYRPSVSRLSVVCLSVMFVRLTQAVQIFGNISTALGTWAIR